MSWIKKGLLVLLGMCALVALFTERPAVSHQTERPILAPVEAPPPPRDDRAEQRKKLLESLELKSAWMLTEAGF